MKNKDNKAFSILKTFNHKDLRLFGRFISSPYFNKHEHVEAFYNHLVSFHPVYNSPQLTNSNLYKTFYRNKKYDDKKIRYLFTDLVRLLEKYLVNEFLETNEPAYNLHLLEAYRLRDTESEFKRRYHQQVNKDAHGARDSNIHYHLFASHEVFENYMRPKQSRKEESKIELAMKELDLFYLSKKLELSCEIENARALLDKNYEPFLLDEILHKLETHPYADDISISAYIHILKILKNPEDEKSFNQLLKQLQADEHAFTKEHLREFYQYLLNFCIKKINSGRGEYHQKIFDIYTIILANGVLIQQGILSPWDYKNIATVSLRLKNYPWAKIFIQDYKKHLPENERENAFNYNMANFYFQKKEFTSALKLLQSVEFTDPVYQLDSRAMLLKIYVAIDDMDALFYHFKAFQTFLERNKLISKFHKTLYGNLIRYTKKFIQARENKKLLKSLLIQLDEIKQVADVQWLKASIEELL